MAQTKLTRLANQLEAEANQWHLTMETVKDDDIAVGYAQARMMSFLEAAKMTREMENE